MFLRVGDIFIDLYRVSAYTIEKEGKGYYLVFFVDGRPFKIEIYFQTKEDALNWLENLEMQFPDLSLTDEVIYGEELAGKLRVN